MDDTGPITTTPLLKLSPLSFAAMLWKRKVQVLVAYSVFGAISIAGVWLWPDTYRSETVILVDGQKIPDKLVSSTVNAELQDRIATISKQIMSTTRLLRIIEDFDLYRKYRGRLVQEELIELMRSDIEIKLETGWTKDRPGAFRVSYRGPSAPVVAAVTTKLGNLFIEENLKSREVEAEGTSEFLRGRLQEAKHVLDQQEAKIREYKQQHNGELPGQATGIEAAVSRLQSQLHTTDDLLLRARESKRMLENSLKTAEDSLAVMTELASVTGDRVGAADSKTADRHRQEVLKTSLVDLQSRYSDNHPDVRSVKAVLAQLQAKIHSRSESPESGAPAAPGPIPVQTAQLLARERERIATLKFQVQATEREAQQRDTERKSLLAQIAAYESRLQQLPLREQEVAAMMRDYETSQMHYRSLLDKIFAADTAAEMERRQKAERFTILDAARIPEKPFSPKRQILLAAGAGMSVLLALVVCLGLELRRNKVRGEWELPVGVAVLGRIAPVAPQPRRHRFSLKPLWTTAAVSGALGVCLVTALQIYRS